VSAPLARMQSKNTNKVKTETRQKVRLDLNS
jgi:hypothetical protein